MSALSAAVVAQLPPGTDPETAAAIGDAAAAMPPMQLMALISDAMQAKQLLESGKKDEAAAIINRHRQAAVDAGLGPVFDQMMSGVLG